MKILLRTLYALFLALDLLGSALTFGAPLETISARLAKGRHKGRRLDTALADAVDWVALTLFREPAHCETSLAAYEAREAAAASWAWWHKGILVAALLLAAGPCFAQARDAPDDTLTPGVVRSDISDAQIRHTAWGKDARHVTPAMKREVFRRYHVTGEHDPSCGKPRCELDHRIPRACGGADDIDNLWPQSVPYWHEKDMLEDFAARQVKAGKLTPEQCQAMFAAPADWRIGFRSVFSREP